MHFPTLSPSPPRNSPRPQPISRAWHTRRNSPWRSLSHELQLPVADIDRNMVSALKQYFDPKSGHFTERGARLVRKDGDLERVLRQQIGGGESSELAGALAKRTGEASPLMRRLDPQDAESISRSIEK
jgi:hypothetical protein